MGPHGPAASQEGRRSLDADGRITRPGLDGGRQFTLACLGRAGGSPSDERTRPCPGAQIVVNSWRPVLKPSLVRRLALTLAETGLSAYFKNNAFTAKEVKNGKPAPDLVLYAAQKMGFAPTQCLVLEDTEVGLQGALAAKMTAWHFCGGTLPRQAKPMASHVEPHQRLDSMVQVLEAFKQIGIT